jgi:uncharacterized protein (DUF1800 family)
MRMKVLLPLTASAFTALYLLADRPVKKPDLKLPPEAYALSPEARARHALNRLAFGPRPGEVARLAQPGALESWISAQLDPASIPDPDYQNRLQQLPLATLPQAALYRDYAEPFFELKKAEKAGKREAAAENQTAAGENPEAGRSPEERAQRQKQRELTAQWVQAKVVRDVYSERQLAAVLGDFWFNHFNVDMTKIRVRFTVQDYQRSAIDPHVLGNFRELLGATAHHSAMMVYLDNDRSTRTADAPGLAQDDERRGGNFSVGIGGGAFFGGRRGGAGIGAGGSFTPRRRRPNGEAEKRPLQGLNENYARELMELHTLGVDGGYTQRDVTEAARVLTGWSTEPPREGIGFAFRARAHDAGEKHVLGHDFPAGRGQSEGEELLDLLAAQPATARHLALQFAQRFVSDNPPAPLVERLAAEFTRTRGDLKALTVALIESPEFWRSAGEKTRTPQDWTTALLRASGSQSDGTGPALAERELDMTAYHCQPPTGYKDSADAWLGGGALERRLNLAHRFARQEWAGTRYELGRLTAAPSPEAGREELIRNLLGESVSPVTRSALLESARAGAAESADLATFVGLIFASPEFQKR